VTTLPSQSCMLVDGPYLDVPAGCLNAGQLYGFTLRAFDGTGAGSWAQVSTFPYQSRSLLSIL
jgi:hypothetical protein